MALREWANGRDGERANRRMARDGGWRTLDFEDEDDDDDEDDYDFESEAVPLAIGYRLLIMRVAL
jgi:hypothetical protein